MSVASITTADANTALGGIFTGTQWIQFHTGQPGAVGTTNVAGNTTRHSTTWNAASGGAITNAADINWTGGEVTNTEVYTFFSVWSASTAGTFHGSGAVTNGSVVAGNLVKIAAGTLSFTSTVAA